MAMFLGVPEQSPIEWDGDAFPPFHWYDWFGMKSSGVFTIAGPYSYILGAAKVAIVVAAVVKLRRAEKLDRALAWAGAVCLFLWVVVPFDIGHVTFWLDWRCLPPALVFFLAARRLDPAQVRFAARAATALALLTVVEWGAYDLHWAARA